MMFPVVGLLQAASEDRFSLDAFLFLLPGLRGALRDPLGCQGEDRLDLLPPGDHRAHPVRRTSNIT